MPATQYKDDLLSAHQFQGKSNDCGPFSAAIVLNAVKKTSLRGEQLGQQMNNIQWHGLIPKISRIENWATFPWGLVNTFNTFNLIAKWKFFQKPETLLRALESGEILIVIIGEWHPMWAHYLTLIEIDEMRGYGFIDSSHPSSETIWKPTNQFLKMWKNYGSIIITVSP